MTRKIDNQRAEKFIELLTANQNRLYSYILSGLCNYNDAEDVMQDTNKALWDKFDSFEIGTNFLAWGMTIANYQILEFRRRKKRLSRVMLCDEVVELMSTETAETAEDDSRMMALKECVEKLIDRDRRLIDMRYDRAMSVLKISQICGKSVQAIYQRLSLVHDTLIRCVRRSMAMEEG